MANQHFTLQLKHDTKHRKWQTLSVTTHSPQALAPEQYLQQYARENQFNPDQIAFRIVEIESSNIGTRDPEKYLRIVEIQPSAATANATLASA